MRQLLFVNYTLPEEYLELVGDEYKVNPENIKDIVGYMRNFSLTYYGIDVDVNLEKLEFVQNKRDPKKWEVSYEWLAEPDFTKDAIIDNLIRSMGLANGPTPQMLRARHGAYFTTEDCLKIKNLYYDMYKPTRSKIFKSMIFSMREHFKLLIK